MRLALAFLLLLTASCRADDIRACDKVCTEAPSGTVFADCLRACLGNYDCKPKEP